MPCMARSRIECGRFASQRSRGSFTCESAEIISRDGSSIPILQGLSNDVFPRQQYHYRFFADGIFLLGVLNPIGATGWARPPGFDIAGPTGFVNHGGVGFTQKSPTTPPISRRGVLHR